MRLYVFSVRDNALVGSTAFVPLPDNATLVFAQNRARSEGYDAYMIANDAGEPLTSVCAVTHADRDAVFAAAANVIWE